MTTNRASFSKRLQKLEARKKAPIFHCVCTDDIERRARAKMHPQDLEILAEVLALRSEQFTPAHRAIRNRWEEARSRAILELKGNDDFIIVLSAVDYRL